MNGLLGNPVAMAALGPVEWWCGKVHYRLVFDQVWRVERQHFSLHWGLEYCPDDVVAADRACMAAIEVLKKKWPQLQIRFGSPVEIHTEDASRYALSLGLDLTSALAQALT